MTQNKTAGTVNYKLIIAGILFFIGFVLFINLDPENPQLTYTAAIGLLMAFWWITEAIPIGATSLLPLILFPLFGILDGKLVSESYINYIIFLYIGGFIMALTIEKWNLHQRIALKILSVLGGSPFRILLGFMFASAFLSMWMSNTATAMMMLPIVLSVITTLNTIYAEQDMGNYSSGLLLGVAYGCSIGGISTLVGTPPNLSFIRIYEIMFPENPSISFGNWFVFALPISFIIFTITLWYLYLLFKPKNALQKLPPDFYTEQYKSLGKITPEEKRVLVLFITLIILWIFRADISIGNFVVPGWSNLLNTPEYINDGSIAIFMAVLLFMIPSTTKNKALANWDIALRIPWQIVLLFGGGFALASGFVESGLSNYLGNVIITSVEATPNQFMAIITATMSILTEFTSNAATTEMMLPIVGGLANELNVNPLLLMIPVTLAGSMAFIFPIATPPNAIIYGAGKLTIKQMATTGFVLNIIAIIVICLMTLFWGALIFNF
ncbi:SLC13 family permease [Galbibacter sp. EGI 63066]|uniref:SLC13 family permease n=1 Tax=Galbibacter sp. EGI 63066 TaxID=2993559 RepID=UPI002248B274|nr:SLC13 family permease [Galbibacter sp. EGI 63066]MCX2678705.1 SLC13 family permease [Galbibacter sp. EGI 63066]